jgi:hypothetical protein
MSLRREGVLPQDADQVAQYYMATQEGFYSLNSSDIRQLKFHLALKDKLEHTLPDDKGVAGKKWLTNSLVRPFIFHYRRPNSCLWVECKI